MTRDQDELVSETAPVVVRVPPKLLAEFDMHVVQLGHSEGRALTRSEVVRKVLADWCVWSRDQKWAKSRRGAAKKVVKA